MNGRTLAAEIGHACRAHRTQLLNKTRKQTKAKYGKYIIKRIQQKKRKTIIFCRLLQSPFLSLADE